jgi:hypothetical protein
MTNSSSDSAEIQRIPSSSFDDDDDVSIDALAVIPDGAIAFSQADPDEQVPGSDRGRFLRLWQDGKEIARLGQSTTVCAWVQDQLHMIIQRLIETGEPEPPLRLPSEQRSQKKRGRPRTTGHSSQAREAAGARRTKCPLCHSGSHALAECAHRPVLD